MTMEQGIQRLQELARTMREQRDNGLAPSHPKPTVREFISWFGYSRRGLWFVEKVREELETRGLHTDPDFQHAYIDSEIALLDSSVSTPPPDNALRIDILPAAHNRPLSVNPNDALRTAITHMMANDFSQVPVMVGPRDVKGMITWESIGAKNAMGQPGHEARHYMEAAEVIEGQRSLFEAVGIVARTGYVLVKGPENTITGIVTSSDLSSLFLQLAEPFLLVGEVESHVRRIIHGRFTGEELVGTTESSRDRTIDHIANLTLGDYCHLLEDVARWERLDIALDRSVVMKQLDAVREIRNNVMHFNPEGLDPEDVPRLRNASRFFQLLAHMCVRQDGTTNSRADAPASLSNKDARRVNE